MRSRDEASGTGRANGLVRTASTDARPTRGTSISRGPGRPRDARLAPSVLTDAGGLKGTLLAAVRSAARPARRFSPLTKGLPSPCASVISSPSQASACFRSSRAPTAIRLRPVVRRTPIAAPIVSARQMGGALTVRPRRPARNRMPARPTANASTSAWAADAPSAAQTTTAPNKARATPMGEAVPIVRAPRAYTSRAQAIGVGG